MNLVLMQVPQPAPAPLPPDLPPVVVNVPDVVPMPPWMVMPAPAVVLVVLAMCAAAAVILWPIMRAIGRRIEGRAAGDPELRQEVQELRERVRELEAGQPRLAELEERLDFAERLLAQRRESEQLRG